MGGDTDWTIVMGQVIKVVMVVSYNRIGNEKDKKYAKSQRKFFLLDSSCHLDNFS